MNGIVVGRDTHRAFTQKNQGTNIATLGEIILFDELQSGINQRINIGGGIDQNHISTLQEALHMLAKSEDSNAAIS